MTDRLEFRYAGRSRLLDDWAVKATKAHAVLLVGTDPDKGAIRSFRVDRIESPIRHVPQQR